MAPNKVKAVQNWCPPKTRKIDVFFRVHELLQAIHPKRFRHRALNGIFVEEGYSVCVDKGNQDSFVNLKSLITIEVMLHHIKLKWMRLQIRW